MSDMDDAFVRIELDSGLVCSVPRLFNETGSSLTVLLIKRGSAFEQEVAFSGSLRLVRRLTVTGLLGDMA